MIKTWNQRCQEHPDHQTGMVSHHMIAMRMQEEIDELRAAVFDPDWDRVKALEESLREHMAEIQRLKALAQPEPIWVQGKPTRYVARDPIPPQRKPLTEEQIAKIDWKDGETLHDFARAIEKAHGIGG